MARAARAFFRACGNGIKPVVDGSIVVSLDQTKAAMRLMAEKARVIAEGAGALVARRRADGQGRATGPIVAVVSGGNIDLTKFCDLVASPAH